MAVARVTFGNKADGVPLEEGGGARYEEITLGGGNVNGNLTASGSGQVLTIYAGADCMVSVGKEPNSATGANRRFIKSGTEKQFWAAAGHKVGAKSA